MLTKTPQATQLPITLSNDFQFSNLIFKKLTIPTGKKQTKQNKTQHISAVPQAHWHMLKLQQFILNIRKTEIK